MDWFYSRSCRGDNSNLCPKFVQNSEREMKMARGTSHRMWTFDEYVEEYEKLLAQLTKAEEEPKSLLAEKGMAGMGFVSKGAEKEIDSLRTQLAAHRWIPVGEGPPEDKKENVLWYNLNKGHPAIDHGNIQIGSYEEYGGSGWTFTHWKPIILPEPTGDKT